MKLGAPVFQDKWDNETALEVGLMTGQGLSSRETAAKTGISEESIRSRLQKIGFRALDANSEVAVRVDLTVQQRALIQQRAAQRGLSMGEYIRRLAVCASRQKSTYDQIVPEDQFK